MKTIEERASEYAHTEWISEFTDVAKESYTKGATEQKAIDIDNACIILCSYACPHKIDSNKCWNTVCDTWEIFRRMMEE